MARILWADDEIESLKPHLLFLKNKGFEVIAVNSGVEAFEKVTESKIDLIFLDENMPGISGLTTLEEIKKIKSSIPIVMITKSEEEMIMEEAIGKQISDYLIKPVNPHQILMAIKKLLDGKRLISETNSSSYRQEFNKISQDLNLVDSLEGWKEIFQKLTYWELQLEISDQNMVEIFHMQKDEANQLYSRFIDRNYEEIIQSNELLSHNLLKAELFPELNNQSYFLIVIDNLRYDQWLMLKPIVEDLYSIESEGIYSSIIPTTTQYARNALFAGLSPLEISKRYAHKWVTEEENEGKNLHEDFFFNENLRRNHLNLKSSYHKITNLNAGKRLVQQIDNLKNNDINTIVYNFVDTLSHARTDMEVIKELAEDESAYRSITLSWFKHSPLFDILKKISNTSSKVFLTTDHGTVRVKNPSKVVGPKNTNSNMRYKVSKNLTYQSKDVIEALHPERINLPKSNISSSYIFAKEDNFFVYPNNYNHFAKLYNDTFQHGGISMEEMLIPYVKLTRK